MNYDILHELIARYENGIDRIYGADHDELFKWRAMYTWRQEWFKPAGSFPSFADRFNAAKKDFSLFIDNSRMHPSAGVIKLWEFEPDAIESLFKDVLFADAHGSISAVQDHMDAFLEGYESLRRKHFPTNWSFKQDRHSASVYLAMNDPDLNYVFKSSEALTMARYVDFGFSIGAGMSFRLENYYRLCDEIVSALKEHASLLEKHFSRLTDGYYIDESLHLLTFDLMYCCRTYGYYKGLVAPVTRKTIRKPAASAMTAEIAAQKEQERLETIAALEQKIVELEQSCDGCEDISLIGVQVTSDLYGIGTVTEQDINKITVQFNNVKKAFVLDKKFTSRPRFENDEEIVEAFTAYAHAQEQIKKIQKQIESA